MTFTTLDWRDSLSAVLCFSPLLLAPGYLLLRLRSSSRPTAPEQLLWSLSLSLPASLVLTAVSGRFLSDPQLIIVFSSLILIAIVLLLIGPGPSGKGPVHGASNTLSTTLFAITALVVYILFATSSIQVGRYLFESVSASDWSVRIPLVAASIRNHVPPGNPFFTVDGHPGGSRYYFYWYSLCGFVGRGFHLPARACLAASVVWSALSLVAMLFLSLKYLVTPGGPLRRQCLLLLALCCVMGLDILPALGGLLTRPIHLYPEIEWWHADRLPSFLGAIIFAPHHIAGMVCCLLAFLVLVHFPVRPSPGFRASVPSTLLTTLIAALCFAAAAGDSTYIAFCFSFVGLLYGLDLLRQRRWSDLASLLAATSLALLLSRPFLHEMLSGPALTPPPGQPSGHFFRFVLRELGDGDRIVGFISRRLHHEVTNELAKHLLALPFVAIYLPLEFGFFLIPLTLHIRRDLRRLRTHQTFTDGERLLWAIFLGAAIPALFISSEPTQGVNDLGRHAGLILRFVVILWSTPIVWEYLERLRTHQPLSPQHPWIARLALVLLGLGLATQLWQIVMDRSFLAIFHHTRRNPEMPFAKDDNLAGRYFDLREGLTVVESHLPANAVVQSNPGSRYQMIVMLYSDHPFAAGDLSCEAAFGGDPSRCKPIVAELQHLFGGPADIQYVPLGPYFTVTAPDAAQTTTSAAFITTCRDLHLAALVAQNSDPAWALPGSWVWQETPVYATPIIRIFACPSVTPARQSPS